MDFSNDSANILAGAINRVYVSLVKEKLYTLTPSALPFVASYDDRAPCERATKETFLPDSHIPRPHNVIVRGDAQNDDRKRRRRPKGRKKKQEKDTFF